MKKIILIAFSFLSLAAAADVAERPEVIQNQESCAYITQGDQIAQQGCCSWHGGMCGCQGGRVVCCDGRYSPSCTCNKEDAEVKEVDESEA